MGTENGLKFMRIRRAVTLIELAAHLHCAPRTAQRRLREWDAINSYNRNGAYYTLPDIPTFDDHGLWRYRGVFFSRFGNLPATFSHLVAHSSAGLTAAESGALLELRPSSFLWSLRNHVELKRQKHEGRYVYFSSDPARYAQQSRQRMRQTQSIRLPTAAAAIAILVEAIKNPAMSHVALSRRLREQRLAIAPETIENLFLRHGLTVKKTPASI